MIASLNTRDAPTISYGELLKASARGTVSQCVFQPEGGFVANGSSSTVVRIPIASNDSFLDTRRSNLRIKLNVTAATAAVFLDTSVYSVIKNMRVLTAAGTPIETINEYNFLANQLIQGGLAKDAFPSQSIKIGTANDAGISAAVANYNEIDNLQNSTFAVGASSRTYNAPIICSGFMQMSAENVNGVYIPLCLIQGGVVLELTLADPGDVFKSATGTATYTAEISYVATMVTPEAGVVQEKKAALQQLGMTGQKLHMSSFTYINQQFYDAITAHALMMGVRARSIKGILAYCRPSASVGAFTANKYASDVSTANPPSNGYIAVGGVNFPNVPLQTFGDFLTNYEQALGRSAAGLIDGASWVSGATTFVDAATHGTFSYGLDLESFVDAKNVIEAGYDTSSQSLPVTIYINTGNATARQWQVFAHCDMILSLDGNGQLSASY